MPAAKREPRRKNTPSARTSYRYVDYWVDNGLVSRDSTVGDLLVALAEKVLKG